MSNGQSHPVSKYIATHLPCGRCRYDMGEVKVWRLVFAHDSPQLTAQVLDGSINTIECPRCRNAAPAFAPFLYADLDKLRAVFVATPALSEVENAEEKRRLLEIATETLDAGRREKLMARVQEAFNYLYISDELSVSDEEVETFNRDYADYLEWEGLPAADKIEKIVEAALAGRSFILSDAELDGVFGAALARLLAEAEKNKQEQRLSVLRQLSAKLEEVRAHEQGQAEREAPSYALDLPEPSRVWELVRNATHVVNASDVISERGAADAPPEQAAPDAEGRAAGGGERADSGDDEPDYEALILSMREAAREKRDLEMECLFSNMLGEMYQGRGLTWRAVGCFERALRISEKINDDRLKGMALGGLGTAYIAKGQVDRGIADIQTAMKFSVLAKDYHTYAVLIERLGRAKLSVGRLDTAKQCLGVALKLYRQFRAQTGSDKEVAWCLYQLGPLCIELGEFEEAKSYLLEALSLCEGRGGSMESGILTYLGICCLRMGEPVGADLRSYLVDDGDGSSSILMERVPSSEGIKYFERALEIADDPADRMGILTNLSAVNLSAGYYHRAIRYYEEMLEILRSGGGGAQVEAHHLANLANIWMRKLDAHKEEGDEGAAEEAGRKALEYFKAAVSLSTEGPVAGRPETFPYITQLAYCAELVGDYAEALKWYRYITGFTEGLRVSFKNAKHKEFFHQTSILTFVRASRCALRMADASPGGGGGLVNEAFYYAEAAKCRLLTDTVNDRTPEPYDTPDESFVSRLPEDLRHAVQFVSEAPVGFHPAGVDEIVKALGAETALLEYSMTQHLGDAKGFWALFAALPGRPDVRLLHRADLEEVWGAREEFYKVVESLEHALESAAGRPAVEEALARSRPAYEAALLRLGRLLLPEEVVAELGSLGIRRLVVVPEAYLFDVPWSALRVSTGAKTVPLIGEAGGGGFEVVVAPSASVFIQCHHRTMRRAGGLQGKRPRALLFGGPDVNVNSDFSAFVGEAIGRDILGGRFETRHFFDDSASRENLLDSMPSSDLCFFYGHASYDFDDPLESHLTISAGADGSAGRYQLTAREILSWHADKVWSSCALFVMASCEGQRTDYSRMWAAREIIGLSTAMFQCGVSGVIGSLWRIRVATVCRLYPQFFRSYASGHPASKSLRDAQLELQSRDDLFSHPHLWGGIYLMGDYDAGISAGV